MNHFVDKGMEDFAHWPGKGFGSNVDFSEIKVIGLNPAVG